MKRQERTQPQLTHVISLLIACIILTSVTVNASAEPRSGNVDLFVVVDTSLSMEETIEEAKNYVKTQVFDSMLKQKDHLTLICFSAEAQVQFEQKLKAPREDLQAAIDELSGLQGLQHYTDIGNALDLLAATAEEHSNLGLPQYAIFVTDGLHDPPPDTKYPGKGRGVVNHPLLDFRKVIKHDNWRIWILGPDIEERRKKLLAKAEETLSKIDE